MTKFRRQVGKQRASLLKHNLFEIATSATLKAMQVFVCRIPILSSKKCRLCMTVIVLPLSLSGTFGTCQQFESQCNVFLNKRT